MSEIPDQADRYFLHIIGVDVDLDAQLEAIRTLLWRHRAADEDLTKEIKAWEDHARTARGRANEHAIDEWINSVHTSIYQDAAHSLAAVGMLAPLLESMLVQSFAGLRKEFATVLPIVPPRSNGPEKKHWDCRQYVSGGGKWNTDIVQGTLQLSEAIGLTQSLPVATAKTLSAVFSYRNKNFHFGLEWPVEERAKFAARIEREQWSDWFTKSETGNKPWIIYMSSSFVDHCLDFTGELLDALGAFVFATSKRMPPDPNIPPWIRQTD